MACIRLLKFIYFKTIIFLQDNLKSVCCGQFPKLECLRFITREQDFARNVDA